MKVADNWSRVIASVPANKTAAVVARGRGGSGLTKPVSDGRVSRETPLPILPVPKAIAGLDGCDMTGQRRGKLTVVGYYGSHPKTGDPRWSVRCACGCYEVRKTRALKNERNNDDACAECRKLQYLKRNAKREAIYSRTGKWPKEKSSSEALE